MALAPGRHPVAAGTTLLAGAGLVLGRPLARHDHPGLAIVEVASGGVALACGSTTVTSP